MRRVKSRRRRRRRERRRGGRRHGHRARARRARERAHHGRFVLLRLGAFRRRRWRPRPSSIVATARISRRWRPSSPGRTRWPSRAAASTSTGHRSRSRWFRVSRRRLRRTSRARRRRRTARYAGGAVAGEEASFRVVAKDAHNNTNDRTTEVGGDSFFYSVIGEGGYVKWAVASAASDGAPGAYDGSFLANVSGAATVRVTLGAALVRETTIVVRPGFFTRGIHRRVGRRAERRRGRDVRGDVRRARRAREPSRRRRRTPRDGFERAGVEGTDATLDVTDRGDGTYASRFGVNETGGWSLTPRAGQIVGFTASSVVVVAGARDWRRRASEARRRTVPGRTSPASRANSKSRSWTRAGITGTLSGDMDEGTLTLIVTDEDGAETTVAPSAVTYHPRTDPDAALRGASSWRSRRPRRGRCPSRSSTPRANRW